MDTRGTTFYVGARLDDYMKARAVIDILTKEYGWRVGYDWTSYLEHEKNANATTYAIAAKAEIDGVKQSSVCIFITPGGRGMWTELGCALRDEHTAVYLVGPSHDSAGKGPPVFYYHPAVNYVHDFDPTKLCKHVVNDKANLMRARGDVQP